MTAPTEGGDLVPCPMCGDARTCVRGLLAVAWADGHEASTESDTWGQVWEKAVRYADAALNAHHPTEVEA